MSPEEFKALSFIYVNTFFNSSCLNLESKIHCMSSEMQKLAQGDKSCIPNCDKVTYSDVKIVLEKIMKDKRFMKDIVI